MHAAASQKEAVTDQVTDSVDFCLKWHFSRPRTQCGRMAGICVCVWMLLICVVDTSIVDQWPHTLWFAHVRTRNLRAHAHRMVSVMINDRRVWIAHWRRYHSGGSALRVRVVWKMGVSICQFVNKFSGRPHRHVPWPADVPFTILRLEIGTFCVIVFTSMMIMSIADEDPRVIHGNVVCDRLETVFSFVVLSSHLHNPPTLAQKLMLPTVASRSVSNDSRDLGQCCKCKSHQHARSPSLPTLDAGYCTQHTVTESVHPCWAFFVITDCHVTVLGKKKQAKHVIAKHRFNNSWHY